MPRMRTARENTPACSTDASGRQSLLSRKKLRKNHDMIFTTSRGQCFNTQKLAWALLVIVGWLCLVDVISSESEDSQKQSEQAVVQSKQASRNKPQHQQACEYVKSAWDACQSNGVQQRRLRLAKAAPGANCEPIKLIRRDCKIGCKYSRGQWSAACENGMRVRVDRLVARLGPPGPSATSEDDGKCPKERFVRKECKRACHYVKSAWSQCEQDGFRTRNLTLDNSKLDQRPPSSEWTCAERKQIKRQCHQTPANAKANRHLAAVSSSSTSSRHPQTLLSPSNAPPVNGQLMHQRRQQESQQRRPTSTTLSSTSSAASTATLTTPTSASVSLTPTSTPTTTNRPINAAQRRKAKLIQQQSSRKQTSSSTSATFAAGGR